MTDTKNVSSGKPLTLADIGLRNSALNNKCDNQQLIAIPTTDQLAVVTHYIQLRQTQYAQSYNEDAQQLINQWLSKTNESGDKVCEFDASQLYLFKDVLNVPFPAPQKPKFTFVDLFAGIGGFRLAFQNLGGQCVYSSEWDAQAQKTYFANYGDMPFGDITSERTKKFIPDNFDILCGGFPCQAFSIAGYQKGFEDTRGTLFFDVAEIIKRKKPKAVYLENVKNLVAHDKGKTFSTIKKTLEDLGYAVFYKVMNAMEYANVPQNRERIFIVCFNKEKVQNYSDFEFPEKEPLTRTIHDCIDKNECDAYLFYTEKMSHIKELQSGITSYDSVYQWRRQYVRENKSRVCPTLTANMGTGGHNVPLILTDRGIRKLSPKECLNFQGYPKEFDFPKGISTAAKYKQAGNSVVVPLIQKVCKQIISVLYPTF